MNLLSMREGEKLRRRKIFAQNAIVYKALSYVIFLKSVPLNCEMCVILVLEMRKQRLKSLNNAQTITSDVRCYCNPGLQGMTLPVFPLLCYVISECPDFPRFFVCLFPGYSPVDMWFPKLVKLVHIFRSVYNAVPSAHKNLSSPLLICLDNSYLSPKSELKT